MTRVRTVMLAALAALAVVLAGCTAGADHTGHGTGSSGSTGSHNDADVMFAQMMIPHHQQAVEMSDLVLAKTGIDPEVRTLAEQIKSAQAPEITTMTGWLTSWGQSTTGPDHAGHDMGGMLSAEQLQQLRDADAATGQKLFLTGMIAHHQGAVEMATTEVADGQHPDAVALAQTIITSQQAEITTMQGLVDRLS